MLDQKIVEKLKERYKDIHPLVFHRSLEHAKTEVELFDILESIPKSYPIVWSEEDFCWIKTDLIVKAKSSKK
jgi:hypothetical protein